MPSRVNGISNLRIKLAFVPRPSAKVRLVQRKSSLSASATLSTICSAVEKRRSINGVPHCDAKRSHLSENVSDILAFQGHKCIIYGRILKEDGLHPRLARRSTTCPLSRSKSLILSKSCSSRLG